MITEDDRITWDRDVLAPPKPTTKPRSNMSLGALISLLDPRDVHALGLALLHHHTIRGKAVLAKRLSELID